MASYTDTQFAQILQIIAQSKLFSELTELTTLNDDSFFASVNTGTSDAQKIKIPLLRGYKGDWNANTNTPTLADGTGLAGDFYRVSVAGDIDLGSGVISFLEDDCLYYTGSVYKIIRVSSVVKLTSDQTISGEKRFTDGITVGSSNVEITDGGNAGDIFFQQGSNFLKLTLLTLGQTIGFETSNSQGFEFFGDLRVDGTITGNISADANDITIDDTNLEVVVETDLQSYVEGNDSALLKVRGTEVLGGTGEVSFTIGTTVFDVAATQGQIKDSTGYYAIDFAGQTGISVISTVVSSIYVYIDNAGTVQQQTTTPTRSEFREKLFLTRLALVSGTLAAQEQIANPGGQYTNSLRDYLSYIKSPKKGLSLSGNSDLTFQVAAGSIFELGTMNANDEDNPNEVTFLAQDPTTFFYVDRDSTLATAQTSINVTQYDNNGTQTTLTNNRFKILTVYKFNSGNHVVQDGQAQYTSLDEAQTAISTRNFVLNPFNNNGTRLGWIIVQKNETDLSDAATSRFVNDEGSTSTSLGTANALLSTNNLSDLENLATSKTNLEIEISTTPVTFATLPASPSSGWERVITDASSVTYRATASGGGSDFAKVIYDGTNWIYS